jgi:hypothetical protein
VCLPSLSTTHTHYAHVWTRFPARRRADTNAVRQTRGTSNTMNEGDACAFRVVCLRRQRLPPPPRTSPPAYTAHSTRKDTYMKLPYTALQASIPSAASSASWFAFRQHHHHQSNPVPCGLQPLPY